MVNTNTQTMFRRCEFALVSDPACTQAVEGLEPKDFLYYDKDGFELNQAEQKYYQASGHVLGDCLGHLCYQQPWFRLDPNRSEGLLLDHALILHRCRYEGQARQQLKDLQPTMPQADLLLKTQVKWGFDFDLDALSEDGTVFEVLHIEYDSRNYNQFRDRMIIMEYQIKHTDWQDAASRVWGQRDQWQHLSGFEQNHWKARFLLGWNRAEYTEKSI